MSLEGQLLDRKSLRTVMGKTDDWNEIAKDCSAFATATGGRLLLGIEEGEDAPPAGQEIPAELPDTIRRKLAERTANLAVLPDIVTAQNGGQYIELRISRALSVVSTHQRIGGEINPKQLKRALDALIERGHRAAATPFPGLMPRA